MVVPPEIATLLARLTGAGHEAVLVGGCVRDAQRGLPVRDYDVATSASPEAVLALFPRAIPIGLRFGTVMIPTPIGPVDVTTYRGADLAADLAARDFTVNAMAFDPARGLLVDPHDGAKDLAEGRLRAVGRADARFREDPLRALRAARIGAQLRLAMDPEVEEAMAAHAARAAACAGERVRAELERLLLADDAPRGVAALRACGIEALVLPGAREDAAAVIGALPRELAPRFAAWLRGCPAPRILARLRFSRKRAHEVERLLALHPAELFGRGGDAGARRLRRRAGDERTLAHVLALREAECAAGAVERREEVRRALAALREALARTAGQPVALALRGDEVMRALACGPGPKVGRALRYLEERVLADPSCNTPAALRALLAEWSARA